MTHHGNLKISKARFIVRAENEDRARDKVFQRTVKLVPTVGKTEFGSPWKKVEKTTCDPCLDSGFRLTDPKRFCRPSMILSAGMPVSPNRRFLAIAAVMSLIAFNLLIKEPRRRYAGHGGESPRPSLTLP